MTPVGGSGAGRSEEVVVADRGGTGRRVGIGVALVVLVALLAGLGWLFFVADEPDPFDGAEDAARTYARSWVAGDLATAAYAAPQVGSEVARRVDVLTEGLGSEGRQLPAGAEVVAFTEDPDDDRRATARLAVEWRLVDGEEPWSHEADLALARDEERWGVVWSPSAVHPELAEGQVLVASRVAGERGDLLDGAGTPLFQERDVVTVGIATTAPGLSEPTLDDLQRTAAAVADAVGVDPGELQRRVAGAPPDFFVEAVTLRRDRYEDVRDQIFDLPGTRFRSGTRSLPPSTDFARSVVGRVGEATAEDIEQGGGEIVAGDLVGQGGLQELYDRALAGRPGLEVRIEPDPDGEGSSGGAEASSDEPGPVLYEVVPTRGTDVQVSLDPRIQVAAEDVVARAPGPAALVAIRPSTGELLAVANGGAGADGFNRAIEGRYPPGSTFKVVTTAALLVDGLSPDEVVACPPTTVVGGRSFVNAESAALGDVPFRTDFAQSCNTAFVSLADRLTDAQLVEAGAALGLRESYDLVLPSAGASIPENEDLADRAAAMVGQGRVLASPLGMATAVATVANGATVTPVLVLDAPDLAGEAPDPGEAPDGEVPAPLDPAVAATLRELMREVVVSGTAAVLADVPGEPVIAKSGTAEFGSGEPPPTHAWMVAAQGDLAVAIVVEAGGFGAGTAGPLLADFLSSLA